MPPVGFTGSVGKFHLTRWPSIKCADNRGEALRATPPAGAPDLMAGIGVLGYGELTPVRCSHTLEAPRTGAGLGPKQVLSGKS